MPVSCTGAKVSGLAGGRNYELKLEAYSTGDKFPPRTSNVLVSGSFDKWNASVIFYVK